MSGTAAGPFYLFDGVAELQTGQLRSIMALALGRMAIRMEA